MARRAPVEPTSEFLTMFKKAKNAGKSIEVDGLSIDPPTSKRPYWRVRAQFQNEIIDLTSRDSAPHVYAAYLQGYSQLKAVRNGSLGIPEHSSLEVSAAVDQYLNQRGPNFNWVDKTLKDRTVDLGHLRKLAVSRGISCHELTASHLRDYINSATRSKLRADHLIGILRTFMKWGYRAGFFSSGQVLYVDQVQWTPPKNSQYRAPRNRREQSKSQFGTEGTSGGQIPTHEQVTQFADGCQTKYKYGAGLIHTSANLGTRANETFIFTADRALYEAGLGNYVDLDNQCVLVAWQYNQSVPTVPKETKTRSRRSVIIPLVSCIKSGFDVYEFLKQRSAQALEEQKQGTNPRALIFPNSRGDVIKLHSLTQVVLQPVADSLGWKMTPTILADGSKYHLRRFTIHSMRDRFGTTAADEWHYNERHLLDQGSWSDPQTIRKFYLGTSDDTRNEVQAIHRELAMIRSLQSQDVEICHESEEHSIQKIGVY